MFSFLLLYHIIIYSVRAITLESIPFSDDSSVICLESRGGSYFITIPYYLLSCRDFTYPESPYDFLDDLVVQSPLSVEWIQHTASLADAKSPPVTLLCCRPPSSPFFLPVSSSQMSREIHVWLLFCSLSSDPRLPIRAALLSLWKHRESEWYKDCSLCFWKPARES